jgi:hypothetical protein
MNVKTKYPKLCHIFLVMFNVKRKYWNKTTSLAQYQISKCDNSVFRFWKAVEILQNIPDNDKLSTFRLDHGD